MITKYGMVYRLISVAALMGWAYVAFIAVTSLWGISWVVSISVGFAIFTAMCRELVDAMGGPRT